MKIQTSSSDIVWNYLGTIVSMASGFILLPILMRYLSNEELGLWYVLVAVANFVSLFEFGFQPTFSRNITYIVSGVRKLSSTGVSDSSHSEEIDWLLLNKVIAASKVVYAAIACIALFALCTVGTAYISFVTSGLDSQVVWPSWIIFCAAIVFNLYFLYSLTILRGYGDVAGENRVKVIAKISQLIISFILLVVGAGLVGAAIGYAVNTVVLRAAALIRIRSHRDLQSGRATNKHKISRSDVTDVLKVVSHIAWRDGAVQIALFLSTQFTSIICSLYLGLSEAGTYSVLLQLCTAVYNFACAYPKSFYPSIQSDIAGSRLSGVRKTVSKGITAYWALFIMGSLGVALVVLPILPLLNPEYYPDHVLFIFLCIYLGLLQQHSLFCNFIVSLNEIPYLPSYVISSIAGCVLAALFCSQLNLGAYGLILGQGISQLAFNNWYWPRYFCKKIAITYFQLIISGLHQWKAAILDRVGHLK